jgi:hypothetical protein
VIPTLGQKTVNRDFEQIAAGQSVAPTLGDPRLSPIGPGKLTANRAGRIGVVSQVHGLEYGLVEALRRMECP